MNFRTLPILFTALFTVGALAQTTATPAAQGSAAAVDTASTSDASIKESRSMQVAIPATPSKSVYSFLPLCRQVFPLKVIVFYTE